jgi:ubiquinone/menaquinone biosynthesis C-methylase UbiE
MHNASTGEHALALNFCLGFAQQFSFKSVLDVGCGTGVAISKMRNHGLVASGVEPVQALIDIAVKKHQVPQNCLSVGSAEKLEYANTSFDAVTEFGVLHHVKRPAQAVKEMMRVSRRGIFLSDENRFGRGSAAWRIIKYIWWITGVVPLGFLLMTKGKNYNETEGDGISYSYSVYDSYKMLKTWADRIFMIPLSTADKIHLGHPLFSSSHIFLCALREGGGGQNLPPKKDLERV